MAERRASPALTPDMRRWCVLSAALASLPLLLLMPVPVMLGVPLAGAATAMVGWRRRIPAWALAPFVVAAVALVVAMHGFQFGRDTGSALLLVMLALKLGETRTVRDGRALIAFGLFAAFAAVLQDQGPTTLLLALPATAAMLAASARLVQHAPTVGVRQPTALAQLRATVLWLALALPLGMAGFWLFPRMGSPLWGVPENAIARTGVSGEMAPGDWLEVLADTRVAFRVRFHGTEPDRDALYWRGPVLWSFDGRTWSRPSWIDALPGPDLREAEAAFSYEVTLEPTDRRFLFALDLPETAPSPGRLSGDLSPTARMPVTSLLRYELRSVRVAAHQPELPAPVRQAALALPEGFNPRIRAEVAGWRAQGLDDRALAGRALDWFSTDFSYSLAAPPLGRHSVDEFLFDTQVGFCEHFTSAFVFMMREAGIPARVINGYVGGYRNPMGDHWRIQQSDAHAWAEIWLPESGWTRVDPTAAVDPSRVFDRYEAGAGPGGGGPLGALAAYNARLADALDLVRRNWNDLVLGFNADRQRDLIRRLGIQDPGQWQMGLVFALAAGLALALTLWLLLREQGGHRDALSRAWRLFLQRLARRGLTKRPHETALAFAERAAGRWPEQATELRSLSRDFARLRYAPESEWLDPAPLVARLRAFRPRRSTGSRTP